MWVVFSRLLYVSLLVLLSIRSLLDNLFGVFTRGTDMFLTLCACGLAERLGLLSSTVEELYVVASTCSHYHLLVDKKIVKWSKTITWPAWDVSLSLDDCLDFIQRK